MARVACRTTFEKQTTSDNLFATSRSGKKLSFRAGPGRNMSESRVGQINFPSVTGRTHAFVLWSFATATASATLRTTAGSQAQKVRPTAPLQAQSCAEVTHCKLKFQFFFKPTRWKISQTTRVSVSVAVFFCSIWPFSLLCLLLFLIDLPPLPFSLLFGGDFRFVFFVVLLLAKRSSGFHHTGEPATAHETGIRATSQKEREQL